MKGSQSRFFSQTGTPARLTLAKDRSTAIKQGHPWVFANYLVNLPKAPAGSLALLRGSDGSVVAQGFFDPSSHLAFRVCAVNPERLDDSFVQNRLGSCIDLRRRLFESEKTDCYRLINGEGDLLPGLVCDIYRDTAVVQLDGAGPSGFWNLDAIAEYLLECRVASRVYRKARAGESQEGSRTIRGGQPPDSIEVEEHGVSFSVNVVEGQKTGFFLDQRDNREIVRHHAGGRTVLNLFSYTGGFSVYAGRGGARDVTSVDSARAAIAASDANWKLNGLDPENHTGCAADVFAFLADARSEKRRWDFTIVDPPSFAPGKQHVDEARKAYVSVIAETAKVTAAGGLLAASSCSSHVPPEIFVDICGEALSRARRRGTVITVQGQPPDHPYPIACRELRYLKFVLLKLEA